MAQRVSRRPLTVEDRVRARVSPCGICDLQSDTETGFSSHFFGFSYQYYSAMAVHGHISAGDEQRACLWLQFRDIILPHRHKQQHNVCCV
jgi:hypothetical protein